MRKTALFVAGGLMSLAFATTAQADTTPLGSTQLFATDESSRTCSSPLIENPFARFGDRRDYVMAPSGSFENGTAGWQLSGGAQRVTEADPVDLGARDGAGMLAMGPRSRAISPTMCVDLDYPTFRVLTKADGQTDSAEFKIEIAYPDAPKPVWEELSKFDGKQFTNAGSGWRLTRRHGHEAGPRRQDRRLPAGGLPLHRADGQLASGRPLRRPNSTQLSAH